MSWGPCYFPLLVFGGVTVLPRSVHLFWLFLQRPEMSFFYLFSKIKHLWKRHIPDFHPPGVLTTNVRLLTVSLLLTWSFCSGCSHSLVCLCSCGTTWWEGRKEDKSLVQNTCMEQPSRSSGWPSPSTGRLILDPVPQSLWNTSHIKSPITLLKGALMYLISKEALKEPICLSIWTDIYLFHGFLLSKGIVYSDVK